MLIVAYQTKSDDSTIMVASLIAITALFPISNSKTAPNTAGTLIRNDSFNANSCLISSLWFQT
jgi:hypothetical protein